MALQISQYVDPGAYVQEVIAPGALNLQTLPILPTIIAPGSRVRRSVNEAVTRGLVTGEALSVAPTTPHTATLSVRGDRRVANTTVLADGEPLSDAFISYPASTLVGANTETFDLSTNNAIALNIDNRGWVTITLTDGTSAVTVTGRQVDVTTPLSGSGSSATAAEVAAGINAGLAASGALGYGTAYNSVASDAAGFVRLTSPLAGAASDVRVRDAVADSAVSALFGSSTEAETLVQVSDTVFDAGTTYTINYIAVDDVEDTVQQGATVRRFLRVGSFAGVGNFTGGTDFQATAGTLNWSTNDVAAQVTGLAETYDLSTNDVLRVSLDSKAAIDIDLNGLTPAPLGYADPSSSGAATADEVAANINAVLAQSETYGPLYSEVASVDANDRIVLTSPLNGAQGTVTVTHPTANDASNELFGIGATQTLRNTGTGARPVLGSQYFVTYTFTRPASDYNNPQQVFTLDQALAFTGPVTSTNLLAQYAELVFRNGAPSVLLIQVDDATDPGNPNPLEFQAGLDAAATRSTATDILVGSTDLDVQTRLRDHIEVQNGPIEGNKRRGWFGEAVDTPIGDLDSPDTFVFRAARTLQFSSDSPGRGRAILVAPPGVEGVKRDILLEDGQIQTLTLDSTHLAAAILGRQASFPSPADSLVRTTLAGFRANEADFTPWVRSERAQLASSGVTVVTFDAGNFILLDPITTERAGGALIAFEQISASVQKDNIERKVRAALDANIVGLVPVDPADFIIDIKTFIGNVLTGAIAAGEIGPFVDAAGNSRALSLNQDIVVERAPNDPTTYLFRFFFNLRYPALRLFGEYTVDSSAFVQQG